MTAEFKLYNCSYHRNGFSPFSTETRSKKDTGKSFNTSYSNSSGARGYIKNKQGQVVFSKAELLPGFSISPYAAVANWAS